MKVECSRGIMFPAGANRAWRRYTNRAPDMAAAVTLCPKRRLVVQAGGNIGAWPTWLSKKFDQVHTFEPEPTNYRCLVHNTEKLPNVLAYNEALSDTYGAEGLRVCKSIGSHYLSNEGEISVTTTTIDKQAFFACDLIVLDIEGYELPALKGAQYTLQKHRPVVMLECKGHGVKKGRGDTYAELEFFMQRVGYAMVKQVRNDQVWVPK